MSPKNQQVHRSPLQPWSMSVRSLLIHLESSEFEAAPRHLGIDDDGFESFSFIEGHVGHYPLPTSLWSAEALRVAGKLLRAFHDATRSFEVSPDTVWQLSQPAELPIEVICHNDFTPYNCIYRDGLPFAMIDFETACPGSRAWDLAYSAYRFVPLSAPENCENFGYVASDSKESRLRHFLSAYDPDFDRDGFLEILEQRVLAIRDFTSAIARSQDPRGRRVAKEGHVAAYDLDLRWLSSQKKLLQSSLE